jgi:hypothetical protein
MFLALWFMAWLGLGSIGLGGIALGEDLSAYYPLNADIVGNVWVYRQTEGQQNEQQREIAAGILDVNGGTAVLFGELNTGCSAFEGQAMGWSETSLVFFGRADCDQGKLDVMIDANGLDYLPRFLQENETKTQNPIPGFQTQVTFEKKETVTVPAGKFDDCIKLRTTFKEGDDMEACQSWFAKSIGQVKSICTQTSDGQTENDAEELVAALINGQLIGNPLKNGQFLSFALATAKLSGCGMLIRNIVLQGAQGPELWWAGFVLNETTFKWELTAAGKTGETIPDRACAIPGLNFTGIPTTIGHDDMSGRPALGLVLPFLSTRYTVGFLWNAVTLRWDLAYIFEPS